MGVGVSLSREKVFSLLSAASLGLSKENNRGVLILGKVVRPGETPRLLVPLVRNRVANNYSLFIFAAEVD